MVAYYLVKPVYLYGCPVFLGGWCGVETVWKRPFHDSIPPFESNGLRITNYE